MNSYDKYYILIHKEYTGEISEPEMKELREWMNKTIDNKKEYEILKNKILNIKVPQPAKEFDVESEWIRLENRLQLNQEKSFNLFSRKYYSIAASIIILLGLAIFFYQFDDSSVIIKNDLELKKRVQLPDNSVVLLNKGAEIEYNFDDGMRKVELNGEAFFKVTKSGEKFLVSTSNSKVEVLGTEFNVKSDESFTSVAVRSGKVSLSNEADENVILVMNQYSECSDKKRPTRPIEINVDSLITWTKTKLTFEDEKLKAVLKKLEEEYSIKYIVEDTEILNKKLSAVFENEKIEVVHKSISTALKISINRKGEKYYITK